MWLTYKLNPRSRKEWVCRQKAIDVYGVMFQVVSLTVYTMLNQVSVVTIANDSVIVCSKTGKNVTSTKSSGLNSSIWVSEQVRKHR